jgi:ABC-type dipeptide/oligopeptide/nickel transport system permease component
VSGFKVSKLIAGRFPATLELALAALLAGMAFGIPAGVLAALRHRGRIDLAVSVVTSTGLAVPEYWSGLLAILVFAVYLHWLPPGGRVSPATSLTGWLESLTLPALTLGFPIGCSQARFVRATMLDVMREQYILVSYSKGLSRARVILKHVLRNSLIPLVTVMGIQMGRLLGGAILVESIYNWPGIGRMMVVAITQRDYALVQANVLVIVLLFSVINLFTDVIYGFLDPRIRPA